MFHVKGRLGWSGAPWRTLALLGSAHGQTVQKSNCPRSGTRRYVVWIQSV